MTRSAPSRQRADGCPIASLHRRQGLSRDNRVLEATAEVFLAKGQARLLKDLPQHRFAPRRKAFFEPIASRHEIVNSGSRLKRVSDSQRMSDDPRPFPPIGIGEPTLIRINPVCEPKIIKVADDAVPGGGFEELRPAPGKAALYQQPVERLEEPAGERMFLAATLPGSTMQRFQLGEEAERLCRCRCCAQLQRAAVLEISQGAAKLLAGIGAQHRVELALTRRQQTKIEGIGREDRLDPAEPASLDRRLG